MKRRYTIILLVVALVCTAVTAQTDEDTSRKYDAFFLEAINQRVKGNNDAAFDLLRHCVDIDSTKSEAWYFLAQYYDALKENDKAQRCVEKAASIPIFLPIKKYSPICISASRITPKPSRC